MLIYHRTAVRQLLEDLAKMAGAYDAATLAAQLHALIDGAIEAATERDPPAALGARALAHAAIAAASEQSSYE